jgi:hypothetical protein
MPSWHPIRSPPDNLVWHTQHSHTVLSQIMHTHLPTLTHPPPTSPPTYPLDPSITVLLPTLHAETGLTGANTPCLCACSLPDSHTVHCANKNASVVGVSTRREPQHQRGYHKALISTAACKMTARREVCRQWGPLTEPPHAFPLCHLLLSAWMTTNPINLSA